MLRAFLVLVVLALGPGCNHCPQQDCPPTDILAACLMNHTCTINGAPTPDCTPGYCGVSLALRAGDVLRVPLDWGAIGAANTGLAISAGPIGPTFTDGTVLFDDSPAEGCTSTSALFQCSPVPSSVQSISFSYSGTHGGYGSFLRITMSDFACLAANAKEPACKL